MCPDLPNLIDAHGHAVQRNELLLNIRKDNKQTHKLKQPIRIRQPTNQQSIGIPVDLWEYMATVYRNTCVRNFKVENHKPATQSISVAVHLWENLAGINYNENSCACNLEAGNHQPTSQPASQHPRDYANHGVHCVSDRILGDSGCDFADWGGGGGWGDTPSGWSRG